METYIREINTLQCGNCKDSVSYCYSCDKQLNPSYPIECLLNFHNERIHWCYDCLEEVNERYKENVI